MDEKERLRISGKIHGPGVYGRALQAARNELADLLRQRREIDRRIIGLQRTVDALLAVCEEQGVGLPPDLLPPESESPTYAGFTDAVRNVLRERGVPMGPTAVRDALVAAGVNMSKYSNPMVPVHNTLKRLCERGEIGRTPADEGAGFKYVWIGPVGKALALDSPPTSFSDAVHLAASAPSNVLAIVDDLVRSKGKGEKKP